MKAKVVPARPEYDAPALRRNSKRYMLLGSLAVLIIGVLARLLFNGPASTAASLIVPPVQVINTVDSTASEASSNDLLLEWLMQPKKPVERDLFSAHLNNYGQVDSKQAVIAMPEERVSSGESKAVEIHANDCKLPGLLRMQAVQLGETLVASMNVTGAISADLYNLTASQALNAILKSCGYAQCEHDRVICVCIPGEAAAFDAVPGNTVPIEQRVGRDSRAFTSISALTDNRPLDGK